MNLFDTHAHLFWEDFRADLEDVLERAEGVGVGAILNLGTTLETSELCVSLAERYEQCWAAAGFHPNDADHFGADPQRGAAGVRELLSHPGVIAVGETGLDFYRDRVRPDVQLESLKVHFDLARESGLPIVLHNREADNEIRTALEKWDEGVTAVLHCFAGDEEFGKWATGRGHYLGLGGVFTFPSSGLRQMVTAWDLDHILLETDSPFLSPVPHRGKRNEPSFVAHTAGAIADALGTTAEEVAERTTANACRLFGLGSRADHSRE